MFNPDTEDGLLQLKPKYQRFDDFVKVRSDIPVEMNCVSDALLWRPFGFVRATTTKLSDPREPDSEICNVAVVPESVLVVTVASEGSALRFGCNTLTALTPSATVYVIMAVLSEYVMLPDSVGLAKLASNASGADAALWLPLALLCAITTMDMDVANATDNDTVLPEDPVLIIVLTSTSAGNAVRSDFKTVTAVTPEFTEYVMLAVLPEYVTLPDSVGAAYCPTKVCATDGKLSRPMSLLVRATTTMLIVLVNGTVIVAVNEVMELVAPDTAELSDAFRTCTWVTPAATVYVMLAV
jgi:hypothetical protein